MTVTFTITGHPTVVRNIQQLRTMILRQGNTSAWNGAQHLFARSRAVVPYLDGRLYNSAYIANISTELKKIWAVGYDTVSVDYAIAVHEIPDRNHPTRGPSSEPKQDHFLSEPRDAMVKTFPRTVADDFETLLRKARFTRSAR